MDMKYETINSVLMALLRHLAPLIKDDETYLKMCFLIEMHQRLDFIHPRTFNQKLQWLKIYDRNPKYTMMVDKYAVKEYISGIIGKQYIVPTLGVWEHFDDIDFTSLPNQFVLKTTHGGGGLGIVLCDDRGTLDKATAKHNLEKTLKMDIYRNLREWPYKNVPHRIIAEQMLVSSDGKPVNDYKFFCFNGNVKVFKVDYDRFVEHHANYYDREGNLLPFGEADLPPQDVPSLVPANYKTMITLAEKIAKDIPFLRIDFYDVNGKIYFGETTFYPASGLGRFTDERWDEKLGEWLELPSKNAQNPQDKIVS